jgi:hypothetical protein
MIYCALYSTLKVKFVESYTPSNMEDEFVVIIVVDDVGGDDDEAFISTGFVCTTGLLGSMLACAICLLRRILSCTIGLLRYV